MPIQFGNTWWGQAYLGALTRIDYENRLARGKSYARNDRISDIRIDHHEVEARVRGSRPKPYKVKIVHTPLSRTEQQRLTDALISRPDLISEILNLQIPSEINDICRKNNISLFAESWRDIKMNCSCPDWAVPCKHIAAVIYTLANEIDKDPFLVFKLHQFDLLDALRKKGFMVLTTENADTIPTISSLLSAQELQRGWPPFDRHIYDRIDLSTIPDLQTALPQYLDASPAFFPQGDFRILFEQCYKRTIEVTHRFVSQDKSDEPAIDLNALRKFDYIEMVVHQDLSFSTLWLEGDDEADTLAIRDLQKVVDLLMSIRSSDLIRLAPDFSLLYMAWEIAHHAVAHGAFVPVLYQTDESAFKIQWEPFIAASGLNEVVEALTSILRHDFLTYLDPEDEPQFFRPEKQSSILISLFIQHLVKTTTGIKLKHEASEVTHLFFEGWVRSFTSFSEQRMAQSIQQWLEMLHPTKSGFHPHLLIQESRQGHFQLSIALASPADTEEEWVPLSEFLSTPQYLEHHIPVMKKLSRLSGRIPPIRQVLQFAGQKKVRLEEEEVIRMLEEMNTMTLLTRVRIVLPKSLEKIIRPKRSLLIRKEGGAKSSGLLSLNNLLSFDWQVAIGDAFISTDEFRALTEKSGRLIKINDQYVILDPEEVKTLLQKPASTGAPTGIDLLRFALAQEYEGGPIELSPEVKSWLDTLRQSPSIPLPSSLRATLRPYQVNGYEWLWKNARMGFGSILADDMGLGKTLQVLTFLQKAKEDGWMDTAPALVIAPATLLTNWVRECERFTPELVPQIYHGSKREIKEEPYDLLMTTYALARRDQQILSTIKWSVLVIDEAQNIKSNTAAQTKSILGIQAGIRIAMSGTPVENRLSEYYSISQFANPGYLGSLAGFRKDFANPIEQHRDLHQLEIFKRMTSPFLLRRLKTDKQIIRDLPDKININRYVALTPQQASLYEARTKEALTEIMSASGIARKGLVLKMLLQLKQICNHPANFLKTGKTDAALTGKGEALREVLDTVLAEGRKVLIFTQYREMGDILIKMMKEWGEEAAFLHGGLSRAKRDEIVSAFQNQHCPSVLILSIKAGGTGLNLTAATHVIHYDLWWNPAVEAQATDRAFRIGQKHNVTVHRLITRHTLEDNIDQLIQKKKDLAELTVTTGEKWIGDLSDKEIESLVRLT